MNCKISLSILVSSLHSNEQIKSNKHYPTHTNFGHYFHLKKSFLVTLSTCNVCIPISTACLAFWKLSFIFSHFVLEFDSGKARNIIDKDLNDLQLTFLLRLPSKHCLAWSNFDGPERQYCSPKRFQASKFDGSLLTTFSSISFASWLMNVHHTLFVGFLLIVLHLYYIVVHTPIIYSAE